MTTKRVALYARVSTLNHGQDPEVQLRELREFCERRGFEIESTAFHKIPLYAMAKLRHVVVCKCGQCGKDVIALVALRF